MTLSQRQEKLVEEFAKFTNWEDRYKHIIELGKQMPEMPEILKVEDIKVKGCQSQVGCMPTSTMADTNICAAVPTARARSARGRAH